MNYRQIFIFMFLFFNLNLGMSFGDAIPKDENERNKMNLDIYKAQQLENDNKMDEAASIYRELYKKYPNDAVFWKLLNIYEITGKLSELENIIKAKTDKEPNEITLRSRLAKIYFSKGDRKKSKDILYGIIGSNWKDTAKVSFVAGEFLNMNDTGEAIDIYSAARAKNGDNTLFANELARAYLMIGEYSKSIGEYLKTAKTSPGAYDSINMVIFNAMSNEKKPDDLIAPLKSYVNANQSDLRASQILVNLLSMKEDFSGALEVMENNALSTGNPEALWNFIFGMESGGKTDIALKGYLDFYKKFPADQHRMQSLFAAAKLEYESGNYESALNHFSEVEKKYPSTSQASDSALKILLISEKRIESERFLKSLEEMAANSKFDKTSRDAYINLGDKYVLLNRMSDAENAYMKAKNKSAPGGEMYAVSTKLFYLYFFSGDFTKMAAQVDNCLKNGPENKETNDILALNVMVMKYSGGNDSVLLKTYSGSKYAVYCGKVEAAAESLSVIAADTLSVLSAYASRDMGEMSRKKGDSVKAAEWFLKSAETADDTTLKIKSLMDAADMILAGTGDKKRAKELYMKAILNAHDSVYESELREKLRKITE